MKKDSKIFIAGGHGLVGSAIVRSLAREGFINIIAPSRSELDLTDHAAVRSFFVHEHPSHVFLAAAKVGGIKANAESGADFLYENLLIQNNVIWQSFTHDVEKLLFLGSSCIYPREAPQPIKEEYFMTGPLEPTNEGYAIAKIAGMKLAEHISKQFGRTFISCMPTNVYGEHDHFDSEKAHVIPSLMRRMHDAKVTRAAEVVIWGTGSARREFLHADDLADACLFLMREYRDHSFLNVGTGEDLTIRELAEMLKDLIGYEGAIRWDTTKPDGMPRKLLDVTKIRSLGWRHSIPLHDGIASTYRWFLENIT